MFKVLFIVALLFFSHFVLAQKPTCDREMADLKNIQSLMRAGQNGESTRNKERKLHAEYQDCRKSKNSYITNKDKYNKGKFIEPQETTTSSSKTITTNKSKRYNRALVSKGAINIESRFQGKKQSAWVAYYQTPKQCLRPKSTSAFAKCLAHRDEQAAKFDIEWRTSKGPQAIKLH